MGRCPVSVVSSPQSLEEMPQTAMPIEASRLVKRPPAPPRSSPQVALPMATWMAPMAPQCCRNEAAWFAPQALDSPPAKKTAAASHQRPRFGLLPERQ